MDVIDFENLKKLINQIVDRILDDDIQKGNDILQLCQKYDIINNSNNCYCCEITGHKQQVVNFIKRIQYTYSNLINFYNNINGFNNSNNSNDNNQIDCRTIEVYVNFLEMVKTLKKAIDKGSSYDELINILKKK